MHGFNVWNKMCIACLVMSLGLLVTGCSKEEKSPPDEAVTAGTTRADVYHLRGRVVSLPVASNPASELQIHHEKIDGFKVESGEVSPMSAMTMSFAPGKNETLEGIAVGDAIQFTFEMQWEPSLEMRVVDIKKLPVDTELAFEKDGGGAGHDGHMDMEKAH